jgi:hypothetical protein
MSSYEEQRRMVAAKAMAAKFVAHRNVALRKDIKTHGPLCGAFWLVSSMSTVDTLVERWQVDLGSRGYASRDGEIAKLPSEIRLIVKNKEKRVPVCVLGFMVAADPRGQGMYTTIKECMSLGAPFLDFPLELADRPVPRRAAPPPDYISLVR